MKWIHEELDDVDIAMEQCTQCLNEPEYLRQKYCKYNDEAEEIRSRISSISSPALKEDKVQSSPDQDPMANDVIHLMEVEDKRDYYKGLYELSMLELRSRCRDAGFSDTQTDAVCMHYGNRERYGYGTVAKEMNITKDRAAYLIQGGKKTRRRTDYRISKVYMDIAASFDNEKTEDALHNGTGGIENE